MKNKRLRAFAILLLLFAGYYAFSYAIGARTLCFFKNTFGMPCPGCGITRATYYLSQGDIAKVLYYNPLIFLVIPYSIVIVLSLKVKWAKQLMSNNVFWIIAGVIFVGFYAYRMLHLFPHTEPLDFYPNGLLPRVIQFIQSLF